MPVYTLGWEDARVVSVTQQAGAAASNRRSWRLWRDDMHTAGWLVRSYECNGSVAGTAGDGVARITSDAHVVGATPGNAHSWSIDSGPGGMGQVCFDWDSTSDGAFSVYWSPSGVFTGGSTTARPTATDEREVTSGTNGLSTTNGAHTIVSLYAPDSGTEAFRVVFINSNVTAGPVAILSWEHAAETPAAWTDPVVCRWMGGAGTFGNRSDWTGLGWVAVVSGTTRVMTLDGVAPQSALDPDSNRLLEPSGITQATLGDMGFINDWWWVDDGVAAFLRYTNASGADPRQVLDEAVWAWPNGPDLGGGSSTAVRLRNQWAPSAGDATPPTITLISPATEGDLPGTFSQARYADIVFEVSDVDPGLRSVIVTFLYASGAREEVVYRRGSFRRGWSGQVDVVGQIWTFTVRAPAGGWPGPFTIGVDAVDAAGNEDA